jgi:hypothetical protein
VLAQAFASTTIVNAQGRPWQPSCFPTFVITACCPFSEPLDDAANLILHRSLQKQLKRLLGRPQSEGTMEEVVGQSPDGSWKELSWAVTGISEQQAIDLGTLYYQWAIFRFDEEGRTILGCWQD